jgi:hypothetical protein
MQASSLDSMTTSESSLNLIVKDSGIIHAQNLDKNIDFIFNDQIAETNITGIKMLQ